MNRPSNRLYHVPLSPFCRKVRLTLAEKKIEVELVEERYWEPSPDFLRRNPAGKVPILKMGTRVMSESQAICEYLDEVSPQVPLMHFAELGANAVNGVQRRHRLLKDHRDSSAAQCRQPRSASLCQVLAFERQRAHRTPGLLRQQTHQGEGRH